MRSKRATRLRSQSCSLLREGVATPGGTIPTESPLRTLGWLDGPYWYKAAAACEPPFGHEPAWQYVGPGGTLLLEYDLKPHQRAAARDSSR